VTIAWEAPTDNGAAITSYTIYIRSQDYGYYFTTPDCDGSDLQIFGQLYCVIPVATLKAEPFRIHWGGHVWAKIIAHNEKGPSVESNPGDGAMLITDADPPISLEEQYQFRTKSVLSIKW
jgi:hypothetical protein